MDKSIGSATTFLFWFIVIFSLILCSSGDGGTQKAEYQEKSSLAEMLRGIYSLSTTSTISYWDKAKALLHQAQLRFFPPNLDFRTDEGNPSGAGETVKEAVKKSFGSSKSTVEDTVKSAAKVVGEAVHKTTEKVKNKVSETGDHSDAEL